MPKKLFVDGKYPWSNLEVYSKYLTTKNPTANRSVIPAYILNFLKSFSLRDAQLMTMVTDDVIKNMVFSVAKGTFKYSVPKGQLSTPVLKKM